MDELTPNENSILLDLIGQCHQYKIDDDQFNKTMDGLKKLIPFDYWSIVITNYDGDRLHIDELSWFRGIEGFEQYYRENKLFFKDPISLVALEKMKENRPEVQFWIETYSTHPSTPEFLQLIERFEITKFHGYTVLYKCNSLRSIGFSVTGPKIFPEKNQRIIDILEIIVPHVGHVAQSGQIGRLADLTQKQFDVYRLLKDGLTYSQAAKMLNITPSGVQKHFDAIKRILGLNSKKELIFGFDEI